MPTASVSLATKHATACLEWHRAEAFQALYHFEEEQEPKRKITYVVNPSGVYTAEAHAAKTLKFAPLTELSKVKTDQSPYAIVGTGPTTLYCHSLPKPDFDNKKGDKEKKTSHMFVPFWWIEPTDKEAEANMKLVVTTHEHCKFPICQNTAKIEAHVQLKYFKGKAVRTALDGTKREKLDEASGQTEGAKRQKLDQVEQKGA